MSNPGITVDAKTDTVRLDGGEYDERYVTMAFHVFHERTGRFAKILDWPGVIRLEGPGDEFSKYEYTFLGESAKARADNQTERWMADET